MKASDFKGMPYPLNHRVDDDREDVNISRIMTKISIFGHKSALGNFGVKGSLGLMAMFV